LLMPIMFVSGYLGVEFSWTSSHYVYWALGSY